MPIYTKDKADTARIFITLAEQLLNSSNHYIRQGYKPKTLQKQQLYFLSGLPLVGFQTAKVLLKQFSTIEQLINTSTEVLKQVKGIGKGKAEAIREFNMRKYK
ncbi:MULTISPECIES: helix-hairpin-helix domain-containing protein [unclassified Carboxylicivirga]|uniref:helix-hairpin-helix domain-containing protein n=1 Tax=Carboxylicivirga TaxID=1628153 RepID=UPI003D33356E